MELVWKWERPVVLSEAILGAAPHQNKGHGSRLGPPCDPSRCRRGLFPRNFALLNICQLIILETQKVRVPAHKTSLQAAPLSHLEEFFSFPFDFSLRRFSFRSMLFNFQVVVPLLQFPLLLIASFNTLVWNDIWHDFDILTFVESYFVA